MSETGQVLKRAIRVDHAMMLAIGQESFGDNEKNKCLACILQHQSSVVTFTYVVHYIHIII